VSRVVVIGGGLGGLAAAARLARLRHDVVVLEAAPTVGGKIARSERGGFAWDTGPSVVTLPAALRDLFIKTGKNHPLESVVDLELLQPLAHYRWADGTVMDLPNSDVAAVASAFDGALGGTAGSDWARFYDYAAAVWSVTRGPFLESPLEGPGALVRLAARHPGQIATVAPWRSLRGVGRRFFTDPRQRTFLDRYATYTGSDPRRAPAALAVVPYVEHTFRGWTVRGGVRRLVDAVRDRAVGCGATVRTGARVQSVTHAGGRVDGVVLADGRRLPADIVVSAVDARQLYGELLPIRSQQRRLRRVTPSLSGFVVLAGVRGRTPDIRPHSVLFPDDYDAELDAVFGRDARPVDDPTVFVSVSTDPALAPPGDESWFVLVNAPRHGAGPGAVDWDAPGVGTAYRELVLQRLADRGWDIRDRIVVCEHRTPADLARDTLTPGGAIYGTSSNGARAAFLRPANRSPVGGLFLVGGSAHPGGGIPLVTLSAAIVAEMIGRA
jgi:phytoene desaturase